MFKYLQLVTFDLLLASYVGCYGVQLNMLKLSSSASFVFHQNALVRYNYSKPKEIEISTVVNTSLDIPTIRS